MWCFEYEAVILMGRSCCVCVADANQYCLCAFSSGRGGCVIQKCLALGGNHRNRQSDCLSYFIDISCESKHAQTEKCLVGNRSCFFGSVLPCLDSLFYWRSECCPAWSVFPVCADSACDFSGGLLSLCRDLDGKHSCGSCYGCIWSGTYHGVGSVVPVIFSVRQREEYNESDLSSTA